MDIILDILEIAVKARPEAPFLQSLHQQYCERGGLSKKQLEGLHSKVSRIPEISAGKLATLEAIIKKKATRYKSEPETTALAKTSTAPQEEALHNMLEKFPAHKRLLFFKAKLDNRQSLSLEDLQEIDRFKKILL